MVREFIRQNFTQNIVVYTVFKLLLLLGLSGCGTFRALIIEPEFVQYYDLFEDLYGEYPQVSIQMKPDEHFKNPKNPKEGEKIVLGHCYRKTKRIHINKKYWDKMTEERRIVLVFHELGHCHFNRDHTNDLFTDKCQRSIMHEKMMTTPCFLKREEHYYEELPR